MTLNASGPISLGGATTGQSINLELGQSATALASINATNFRTLAGVASGQISLSNFYGKSNIPAYWISNTTTTAGNFRTTTFASSGNVYLVYRNPTSSSPTYALYLTKLTSAGAEAWTAYVLNDNTGFAGTTSVDVNEDSSGNVYFSYWSTADASVRLIKFNSSGTLQYQNLIKPNTNVTFATVTVDSSGNTYLQCEQNTQLVAMKVDNTGALAWCKSFQIGANPGTVLQTFSRPFIDSSGNIYLGFTSTQGTAYSKACVLKLNSAGTITADYAMSTSGGSVYLLDGPVVTSSGDVYFTVSYTAMSAAALVRIDSAGTYQWAYTTLTAGGNNGFSYVTLGESNSVIASVTQSSVYNIIWNVINYASITSAAAVSWCRSLSNTSSERNSSGLLIPYGDGTASMTFRVAPFISTSSASSAGNNFIQSFGMRMPLNGQYGALPIMTAGTTSKGISGQLFDFGMYIAPTSLGTLVNSTAYISKTSSGYSANTYATVTATSSATIASVSAGFAVNTTLTGLTNGSVDYTIPGDYTWLCPSGVTTISGVVVAGGGGGIYNNGGGGGGIVWFGNQGVTAGTSYSVRVGAGGLGTTTGSNSPYDGGESYFYCGATNYVSDGGYSGGTYAYGSPGTGHVYGVYPSVYGIRSGGSGGARGGGGGGPGYSGNGGSPVADPNIPSITPGTAGTGGAGGSGWIGGVTYAGCCCCYEYRTSSGGGGGVGLMGQGPNGLSSAGVSNSGGSYGGAAKNYSINGGLFGAGGGAGGYTATGKLFRSAGGTGGNGAVRIMWPGTRNLTTFSISSTGSY